MLLEDLIDGKNRLVSADDLRAQLDPLFRAYREVPAKLTVLSGKPAPVAAWLLAHL